MNKNRKIIVFGGFAGKNAGDEAQIDATYLELTSRYPNHLIKIMSHVIRHTYYNHYHCLVGENSRAALFDTDRKSYYKKMKTSIWAKAQFWFVGNLCAFNAFLIKHDLPTVFIGARKSAFLYEVKTSDLVFFSGGGYLTGPTLPRLWDHLFVIRIADILDVPVVCSGQTIGMWDSDFTKRFAAKELKKVKVITTRDCETSINELRSIGLNEQNFFEAYDDALFCAKEDNVDKYLNEVNLINKKFFTLNILKYNSEAKEYDECVTNLKNIVKSLLNKCEYEILLLPFAQDDEELMEQFIGGFSNDRLHYIRFDKYDFKVIKGIIGKSEMCITMRHHPIIFSLSQSVPVISLMFTDYFIHKNMGAMKNFGLEKYCIDLTDPDCQEKFEYLFQDIQENCYEIKKHISNQLDRLTEKKEHFWELVSSILEQ